MSKWWYQGHIGQAKVVRGGQSLQSPWNQECTCFVRTKEVVQFLKIRDVIPAPWHGYDVAFVKMLWSWRNSSSSRCIVSLSLFSAVMTLNSKLSSSIVSLLSTLESRRIFCRSLLITKTTATGLACSPSDPVIPPCSFCTEESSMHRSTSCIRIWSVYVLNKGCRSALHIYIHIYISDAGEVLVDIYICVFILLHVSTYYYIWVLNAHPPYWSPSASSPLSPPPQSPSLGPSPSPAPALSLLSAVSLSPVFPLT